MILDLRDPAIWREILKHLDLLRRISVAENVLISGRSVPTFNRHSENLFADLEFKNPLQDTATKLVINALKDQINDCYDGGRTLVTLIANIVEAWDSSFFSDREFEAIKNFELLWSESTKEFEESDPFEEHHLFTYLLRELADVKQDVLQTLVKYYKKAGELSQLFVIDGYHRDTQLLTAYGYRVEVPKPPIGLSASDFTNIQNPLVICLDCKIETSNQLEKIWQTPQIRNSNAIVFCRGYSDLAIATSVGNFRDQKLAWMLWPIKNQQLEDIAFLANTKLHPYVFENDFQEWGFLKNVEFKDNWLTITYDKKEPDLQSYVDEVRNQRELNPLQNRELFDHRLALLTGDYYELALGTGFTKPELLYTKQRVNSVVQSIRQLRYGSTFDYATRIRQVLPKTLEKLNLSYLLKDYLKGFSDFSERYPFPARTLKKLWDRAHATALQFLRAKVLILNKTI